MQGGGGEALNQVLPAVGVVIPAKEASSERLARCLEALDTQTVRAAETVVVVPWRVPIPKDRWPWVRFMYCPNPPSFCRAVNAGIAATGTSWVLLLNDDVVVEPDFVERLLGGIPSDGRIGMVCGKLLSADGRRIDSAGQFMSLALTAYDRGHGCRDTERFNAPGYVFSAQGAAALYRREMLWDLGGDGCYLDESFGMYYEELDLAWRAQRVGWRAYYVPDAIARHARGATAKTRTPRWSWLRRYYLPWLAPKLQARYVLNRYRLMARYETLLRLLTRLPWVVWCEARLWAYLVVCARPTIRLLRRSLSMGRHRGSPFVRRRPVPYNHTGTSDGYERRRSGAWS